MPITDVVSIYQFQRTGSQEGYQTTPTYQNVNACITPTGTDIQSEVDGVGAYQLFEIYLYDVTVQVHNDDKILTATGLEYHVNGAAYIVNNQYMQYVRLLARQVM